MKRWWKQLWCKHEIRSDWESLWRITVGKPDSLLCHKCGLAISVGLNQNLLTKKDEQYLKEQGILGYLSKPVTVRKWNGMEVALVRRLERKSVI